MRYFIIVGEASADLHASRLVEELKRRDCEASFAFMGGDLLALATGKEPIVHYRDVAFMGIIPVLRNLFMIKGAAEKVQKALLEFNPDVVIPVDFASFNFRYILPFVKKHLSCPIYYYIAPKLWAWKKWRIKTLRSYVDLLLCILPFEEKYFAQRGVKAVYVGNPCVDATLVARSIQRERSKQIAILPGSRRQELKSNLPVMLSSVRDYSREGYTVIVAGAPGLTIEDYIPYLGYCEGVQVVFSRTYELVQESMVALVTSGTATLETALLGTPQIVLYRIGGQRIARWVFNRFFTIPYISLVNIILGKCIVPELIGSEVNVERVQSELKNILDESSSEHLLQLEGMNKLRETLGEQRTSLLVTDAIITYLKGQI